MKSHSEGFMQPPVPLSEIPRHNASSGITPPFVPPYSPDAQGMLHIKYRPDCMMVCFMCPFFLGIGCCLSKSTDLDFDDYKKTVRIASCPGFCFCYMDTVDIPYSDIANVAAIHCPHVRINKQTTYKICIITRAGVVHAFTGAQLLSDIKDEVLSIHRYMFGRLNKEYRPPLDFIFMP